MITVLKSGKTIIVVTGIILLTIFFTFWLLGRDGGLKTSEQMVQTITIYDRAKLGELLQNKQFAELNSVLDRYQRFFENDHTNEFRVYDAFLAFRTTSPPYKKLIQLWIESSPDQYQPYLCLAEYYYAKAWEERGTKFAGDTSKEEFQSMHFYMEKAHENLLIALDINPQLMIAYNMLLGMSNATGDTETENEIIAKTTKMFPTSFLIYFTAISAKEPKWGGSYRDMGAIAKQAQKHANTNPMLTTLPGFIDRYKVIPLFSQKKYDQVLELYNKAISYGEYYLFYYDRACLYYYQLEDRDRALEDINKSIELRPLIADNHLLRSKIYVQNGDYEASLADVETIKILKPGYSYLVKMLEWASKTAVYDGYNMIEKDPDRAIELFNISLKYNSANYDSYYFRGVAYSHQKEDELALTDFKQALKINPNHFYSYESICDILAKVGKWKEILGYWNTFILLEPENDHAYFERSKVYSQLNDMVKAADDMKRACDLGNAKACQQIPSFPST